MLRAIDVSALAFERARPGGDRVRPAAAPREQVAEMILHLSVARQLLRRRRQILLRLVQFAATEMRPPEAIEIRRVAGIGVERALHEPDRLVELLVRLSASM